MDRIVVLVTDRIYTKTRRHIQKVRDCLDAQALLFLARVEGFPDGLPDSTVQNRISGILTGRTQELAKRILDLEEDTGHPATILALNQSGILPAIAIQRAMGCSTRTGLIESCDKSEMRRLLLGRKDRLATEYCVATPGEPGSATAYFDSTQYIVKPAFGMSSADVKKFESWDEARRYAESPCNAKEWVPSHVMEALSTSAISTNQRVIEPYVAGTEFSIDGWIDGHGFFAMVHHKLRMVESSFFGDGPTISPPAGAASLPTGYSPLSNCEEDIRIFGREVLDALKFGRGVFHIEARERADGSLFLIEVNPRAPGGSLWKSALLRTGFDLEQVDAMIQLGKSPPKPGGTTHRHVLHYPFYATNAGILSDWGDLTGADLLRIENLTVDFVMEIGDAILPKDLLEEPYLAFAVTGDDTLEGLLGKCQEILNLTPPTITDCVRADSRIPA